MCVYVRESLPVRNFSNFYLNEYLTLEVANSNKMGCVITLYRSLNGQYGTSLYGMKQMISAPTHILQHSSSCIDLIFVNQPNLVIDSRIHPSLYRNCHHQVIFSKLNLKIEYPPPYARVIDRLDWVNLF